MTKQESQEVRNSKSEYCGSVYHTIVGSECDEEHQKELVGGRGSWQESK